MTFDAWETGIRPSSNTLIHWGIPGMKHGRRRYQNEDGTWTEAGLAARRKREGFGEKKEARREHKAARKEARAQARAANVEARRKRNVKNLTDDELKARIKRLELEQEYRELNKSPLLKTGEQLVGKYLDYKGNQQQRAVERNRQIIELERLKTQQLQAKENTKQSRNRIRISRNEASKAKQDMLAMRADVKGGKKYSRKAELVKAKTERRNSGLLGLLKQSKKKSDKEWEREREELRAKQQNAENVARSNAEREKAMVEKAKYEAETARHNASKAAYESSWRKSENESKLQSEKDKKKKKK